VQYEFQVATSSTFGAGTIVADSLLVPATNTWSPPPGALASSGTYYWHWKTATGSYSAPRSFTIKVPRVGTGDDSGPLWSAGPLSVNEISGNLLVSLPGPSYPTDASPMSASVSYNSLTQEDGGLGAGWLLDAGPSAAGAPTQLVDHNWFGANRMDAVEARFADGSSLCFTHVGDTSTYAARGGSDAQLSQNQDRSWTYTSGTMIANFRTADSTSGVAAASSITDVATAPGKGALTYTYSTLDPSKVTSVSDDSGRTLSFSWNSLNPSGCASAIVCITGPDAVTWKYIGDATGGTSGRLARINDGQRDIAAISYDATSGLLNKLQNANDLDPANASPGYNGAHAVTIVYDGSSPSRVQSVNDGPISNQAPSTSTTSFAYFPGAVATTATRAAHPGIAAGTVRTADGYTTVTPPNQQGQPTPKSAKVFYDNRGNTLEQDDTLGNATLTGYNTNDQVSWVEDEDGNPTDYTYQPVTDALLSKQGPDPDGAGPLTRPTTSYRYDEKTVGDATTAGPALQGLQGGYYDNPNLTGRPKLLATDAAVDQNWGSGGPSGLGVSDNFSVRWSGNLVASTGGAYTFTTVADEGTRLTIDGIVAVDNWRNQTLSTTSSQPITLAAGRHKLALEYHDTTGAAEVHLHWACASCSPAIADQVIPASALEPAWLDLSRTGFDGDRFSWVSGSRW
jgi:hypothetical protein